MPATDSKLTFETFVVGPANRLASAAAKRAAESPGKSYNPLFIYAASGLGKSHILSAISHTAEKSGAGRRVLYLALETYIEELTEALEAGERDELRERYRDLDILLMDDVQFLAGQPEAQEMLLSTLDALSASGSQIVLASDRPPAEIDGLDARLLSRFSGGLIVDIAPPEYETRVAIIRRKTEERGQTLEEGVAPVLARYPFRNVRELGGALNRILAIQDLEERPVTANEIEALMGQEGSGEIPAPTGSPDDYGSFLDEISTTLADTVEQQEEEWRKATRKAAEAAERAGYSAQRLRTVLEEEEEPEGWEEVVETFEADVGRLEAIDEELDRLGNPWPDQEQGVLHDPERLDEAEALLVAVQERTRPFPVLGPGARLTALSGRVPGLALKATQQLVLAEKPQYNPLFFWSKKPEARAALMAAAGRTYRAENPGQQVAVISVEDFAEDFIRALSAGVAGAWRERWWTVDLLLVHGAEALSDTERAQDEFFHLFEALKRRGSRVMIGADRPPSGIGGIDERLRSRFEGGLVLEVTDADVTPEDADLTVYDPAEVPGGAGEKAPEEAEAGAPQPPPQTVGSGGLAAEASGSPPEGERQAEAKVGSTSTVGESEATKGHWVPSREKAVWFWPQMQDRLVEDLE